MGVACSCRAHTIALPPCYFLGVDVGQNGQCFLLRFVRTERAVLLNPPKKTRRQGSGRYHSCLENRLTTDI